MKVLISLIMLFLPITAFAQDDVYYGPQGRVHFDEVIQHNTVKKNVLVEENEVIVYHHKKNVKEKHLFYSEPRKVRCSSRPAYVSRVRATEPCGDYRRVEQVRSNVNARNADKWLFFFDFNSSIIKNKEELGHLIDHVKYNGGNIYIDAYGDEETGDFYSNEEIAKRRANSLVNYLIREGIDPGRMYVRYIGCTQQPYGNNNLNRCVIVKIG